MATHTRGVELNAGYQIVLENNTQRRITEFVYYGNGEALLLIGNSTRDADAIELQPGAGFAPFTPIGSMVRAKGDGKLVIITDDDQGEPTGTDFNDSFQGDTSGWIIYEGQGEISVIEDPAFTEGHMIRIGNNDGNDERRMIHSDTFNYDPNLLYRITCTVRSTVGDGEAYVGVAGVGADGNFVSTQGDNRVQSQHYFAKAGGTVPTDWTTYTGYFTGYAEEGESATTHNRRNIAQPGNMHSECRGFRPFLLVNTSDETGIYEVDDFSITTVPKP